MDVDDEGVLTIAACSATAVALTELALLLLDGGGEPLLFLRGDFDLAMIDQRDGTDRQGLGSQANGPTVRGQERTKWNRNGMWTDQSRGRAEKKNATKKKRAGKKVFSAGLDGSAFFGQC